MFKYCDNNLSNGVILFEGSAVNEDSAEEEGVEANCILVRKKMERKVLILVVVLCACPCEDGETSKRMPELIIERKSSLQD